MEKNIEETKCFLWLGQDLSEYIESIPELTVEDRDFLLKKIERRTGKKGTPEVMSAREKLDKACRDSLCVQINLAMMDKDGGPIEDCMMKIIEGLVKENKFLKGDSKRYVNMLMVK